ncbi:unnamed protein product [Closterium sp. NIES-53]
MHLLPEVDLRSEGVDRVEGAARPDLRCRNIDAGEGAVRVALERGRAGATSSIHERIEPAAEPEFVDARVGADEDSGGGLPSPPTEGWRRQQQRLRDAREPTWQRT